MFWCLIAPDCLIVGMDTLPASTLTHDRNALVILHVVSTRNRSSVERFAPFCPTTRTLRRSPGMSTLERKLSGDSFLPNLRTTCARTQSCVRACVVPLVVSRRCARGLIRACVSAHSVPHTRSVLQTEPCESCRWARLGEPKSRCSDDRTSDGHCAGSRCFTYPAERRPIAPNVDVGSWSLTCHTCRHCPYPHGRRRAH